MIYTGFSLGEKFTTFKAAGINRNVTTLAVPESLWSIGGTLPFLTSSINLYVASTNTQDASAGSGSKQIKIEGLDENFSEQTETFTLNGQTPVTSSKTYMRVNNAYVTYAGSEEKNVGDVNIGYGSWSSGVPSNYVAQIPANEGEIQQALFTIPANKKAFVVGWNASVLTGNTSKTTTIQLICRENGRVTQTQTIRRVKDRVGLNTTGTNSFVRTLQFPLPFPPKADLFLEILEVSATSDITGAIELVLVDSQNAYNY